MSAPSSVRVRAFAREERGSASIELAIGAVVLLAISALCFDLYSRVKADTAGLRMAVTVADYLSRDANPDGDELRALAAFLHTHELGAPADLVYVLSALRQPSGTPPPAIEVLWSDDTIRFGEETRTDEIAAGCAHYVDENGVGTLPESFKSGMEAGEVLIVAEVCTRLRREGSLTGRFIAGDIYGFHAVPARDPSEPPAAPLYTSLIDFERFAHRQGGDYGNGNPRIRPETLAIASASRA